MHKLFLTLCLSVFSVVSVYSAPATKQQGPTKVNGAFETTGKATVNSLNINGTDVTATAAEINNTASSTGNLQTQIDGKVGADSPTFTTTTIFNYATASTVPYFDAGKNLISSIVTAAELGYLSGVTSAIQTQLDAKVDNTTTVNSYPLSSNVTLGASDLDLLKLGSPTYATIQQWMSSTQSAGIITGGDVTDNGDGTVDVSTVSGIVKTTDSAIGSNRMFELTGLSSQALTDNSINYLSVDYNSGSPQWVVGSSDTSNDHTIFNVARIYREGTTVDILPSGQRLYDFVQRVHKHHTEEDLLHFASGATVSETGTRNIAITSGVMYSGLNRIVTDAIDTSVADTFEYYYYNGSAWIQSDQTQIDNTQYNNTASGLATLSNNQYGVHWTYKGTNGNTYVLYGQASYTLTDAQNAQPPASLPEHVANFGVLRAKIIILKSDTAFTEIQSVMETAFQAQFASAHNDLSGLQGGAAAEYYHMTSAQHAIATQAASASLSGYVTTGAQQFAGVKTFTSFMITPSSAPTTDYQVANKKYVDDNASASPLTTKGDIYTYSTANARLAVGTDGQVLSADSAETTGLKWIAALTNPMTTQGDLIIGGVSGAATRLAAGTNGYILSMQSGSPAWISAPGGGDMLQATYDPASIAEQLVGLTASQTLTNKTLTAPVISTISNTGTLTLPTSTDTLVGRDTTDTLTNKTLTSPVINVTSDAEGDVYYRNGSGVFTRLGIGTNGQVLTVNSGATAPEWAAPTGGMTNPMTTAGDIIYGGSSGTPTRLAIGTAGQVLTVNSGATGYEFTTPSSGSALSAWGKTWQAVEMPQDWKESVWTNVGSNRPSLDYDQLNIPVWRVDYAVAEGLGIFITPRIPSGVTNLVFTIDAQAQTPGATGDNMGWKADIVRYRAGTAQTSIETVTLGSTAWQTTGITQASYSVAVSGLTNSVTTDDVLAIMIYPNTAVSTPKQTDWMVLSFSIGVN